MTIDRALKCSLVSLGLNILFAVAFITAVEIATSNVIPKLLPVIYGLAGLYVVSGFVLIFFAVRVFSLTRKSR